MTYREIFAAGGGSISDPTDLEEYESVPGLDAGAVGEYMKELFGAINASEFSDSKMGDFRGQLKDLEKKLGLRLFEFGERNISPLRIEDPRVACIIYFDVSNNWGLGGLPDSPLPCFMG
ncbi:MAG: hypothetical protein E4H15_07645, partial [Syntrophobacterales bacterium]